MKNLNINLLLILFVIIILSSCSSNNPVEIPETNYNEGITYIPSMKTPRGTMLFPAEEGPPLSVFGYPTIDLNSFSLEINGLVDSSFNIPGNELKLWARAQTDIILMYCVDGWEVWGIWEGILVKELLKAAHVQPEGKHVLFSSADGGYTTSLPISYLEKYNVILAYNVNNSSLDTNDGFPLRLIAYGKFGYKWIKWVNKLEVIDKSQAGYWENDGYSDEANVPLPRRMFYEGEDAEPLEY